MLQFAVPNRNHVKFMHPKITERSFCLTVLIFPSYFSEKNTLIGE